MHPEILTIPIIGRPIYSYGLMLGISFMVGWYMTLRHSERDGLDRQVVSTALVLSILGALVGARALFFITNPGSFHSLADFFALNQGGLVAYGGFIGGVGLAWLYCRSKKLSLLRLADHAAPALALGTAITRIGCFLYGCCYGAITGAPWAVSFPEGSPAYNHHIREHLIQHGAEGSLAVYPTQLHETGYGLLIFAIILLARRIRNRFQGMLFLLFVSLYGIFRFVNEFFRADTQRGSVGLLSTSQFISLLAIAAAVAGGIYLHLRSRRYTGAAQGAGEGKATRSSAAGSAGSTTTQRGRRQSTAAGSQKGGGGRRKGRRGR